MSEKSKFGAIFILGIVFTIGGLLGVGGTIYYLKQSHGFRQQRPDRSIVDLYRTQVDRMTHRLDQSLNLTDEQLPLIRAEIEKFGNAMKEVNESMRPRFDALMQERSIAIEQHLTEDQLKAFREQRDRHRKNRKRSHEEGRAPRACSGFKGFKKTC